MHKRNKKINKKNSPRRTQSLSSHEKAQKARREIRRRFHRLRGFTQILFLPADADLAAAFSIPVSVKPAAGVRWAIRDGPHKNMQAGKRGIL